MKAKIKKWTDEDLRTAFEDGCKFINFNDLIGFLKGKQKFETNKKLSVKKTKNHKKQS